MDCVILYGRPEVERVAVRFFFVFFHLCTAAFVLFSHTTHVRCPRSPPATATRADRSWRNAAEAQTYF